MNLQRWFFRFASISLLLCLTNTGVLADSAGREVISKQEPMYPAILKNHNIGGVVRVQVAVTPAGTVKEAKLVGGNPILGDAAIQAIRQWKYTPASTESVLTVEVRFTP